MHRKILIVEDDADIAGLLRLHLQDLGCSVDHAGNGDDGLDMARSGSYDMLLLDLMLPGLDGLDICRQLRHSQNTTPILMLTAKSSELDRVVGLELGADDYLTKPFSYTELQARVKAIFRRIDMMRGNDQPESPQHLVINELIIDPGSRSVSVSGTAIELTATEFDLLYHFARHPGRVFSRAQLLDSVWGYGHDGYEHTVNSHINRLRKKIERSPSQADYIQTVWGVGYKFIAGNHGDA